MALVQARAQAPAAVVAAAVVAAAGGLVRRVRIYARGAAAVPVVPAAPGAPAVVVQPEQRGVTTPALQPLSCWASTPEVSAARAIVEDSRKSSSTSVIVFEWQRNQAVRKWGELAVQRRGNEKGWLSKKMNKRD